MATTEARTAAPVIWGNVRERKPPILSPRPAPRTRATSRAPRRALAGGAKEGRAPGVHAPPHRRAAHGTRLALAAVDAQGRRVVAGRPRRIDVVAQRGAAVGDAELERRANAREQR